MNHFSFFNPKKALMIALMGTMMNICLTALAQIPGYVSPQQLVGWYSFAGNAEDASSAQNHGVVMNATFSLDRFNNPGQALYLSGQSAFVSIPHRPSFNELPLTVSCWVKPSSEFKFSGGPGGGPLITKGIGDGANTWYISTMRGGDNDDAVIPAYTTALPDMSEEGCACGCNGVLEGQGDCGTGINYDGDIFDNAWHMITFSVDHTAGKLYVDGTLINEQAWVGEASEIYNTVDLMLGAMQQSGGPWVFYKGLMDEVGIWNRVLSNYEVLALYTGETLDAPCSEIEAVMATDLIGNWPFCGNADDHGPLAAHGTVMGATLVADGLGFAESAYHFENDSITLPVPLDFLNNDFTLHLEAKLSSFDGTPQTLLESGGLHIFYQEDPDFGGNLHVLFEGDGEEIAYTVGFVDPTQWHTITLAQTEGYVMLFINGQFYNEGFYNFSSEITQSNTLNLGRGINGLNNFSGDISNVALWQRVLDFEEIIALNEATGLITHGCTDPSACNFDPQANTEDWSCAYSQWSCDDGDPNTVNDMYDDWCNCQGIAGNWETGCIDPSACNFDWLAVVDDGSCVYPGSACDDGDPNTEESFISWWCECEEAVECNDYNAINYFPGATGNTECLYMYHLSTFYDANMNGQWDWEEAVLPNFPVRISGTDSILHTDEWGNLFFEWPVANDILVGDSSLYTEWTPTTPLTFFPDWGYSYGTWGFMPIPTGANAWVNSIWNPIIHCEVGYDGGTDVHNVGLEPLIVLAEFTFDSLLAPSLPDPTIATIDSVGAGYFSFISDTLYSLEHFPAVVHIPSPGLEYLDMVFPITVTTTVYDTAGQVVTTSTFNYEPWVACAYDPNDLSAYSGGHYDQNYVLADQRILFKVRFQNTGNLPAEDVVIQDVLNPLVWNLDSFEPVSLHVSNAPTEYFDTDIDLETGEVNFYLDNIYLPDSGVSVDASQGYVLFYVNTRSDLEHGTVLNNTAQIYFDANPPIITNTTTHTIFDCETIQGPTGDFSLCAGAMFTALAEQDYVDSYNWSLDGDELASTPEVTATLPIGMYDVQLQIDNALCTVTFDTTLVVHPEPVVEITMESGVLSVSGGTSWQWYYQGEALDANQMRLTPHAHGTYTVVITDEFGCTAADEIAYNPLHTDELNGSGMIIYPNPAETSATLMLPEGEWEVTITDGSGRLVTQFTNAKLMHQIDTAAWAPGMYTIRIGNGERQKTSRLIIR
jgi:uncharacterized repeat protein (TIGR01451 family)